MHDAMKAYHESWERELDRQFLKNDRYRKRAYICSPLSGSTAEEELSNIWRARAYMLYPARKVSSLTCAPGRSRVSVPKPQKRFMPCSGRTR